MDELKRKLVSYLQDYLRQRMDFIASIPTMDPLWTARFDIISNVIEPLTGDIRDKNESPLGKCPRLFLLFNNILRSEEIRAGGVAFEIKIYKPGNPEITCTSEFKFVDNSIKYQFSNSNTTIESTIAISMGVSGCQAFYGILENILRNSGRHSNKNEIKKVVDYSKAIEKKGNPANDAKPLKITIEFYYDWDGDYSDKKDDFVKIRIYDNMLGWQKENDRWVKGESNEKITLGEINAFLKPDVQKFDETGKERTRDGRIIDDTGNTVQGAWGFKEMRICASFLRGFKIQDYEKKELTPPVISAIPVPDEKDQSKARLGFEFFIPKVKNLFIVSKTIAQGNNINHNELKDKGIYIESDVNKISKLQEKGVLTHEFIAIDVDDENNKKYIEENILLLPYKLFFITSRNSNLDEIFNLFKNIRYDLYIKNSISNEEKENLKNLVISQDKLNQWLTQNGDFEINVVKYNNYPPAERVFLEIYKRWNGYLFGPSPMPTLFMFPSKLKNLAGLKEGTIKQTGNFADDKFISSYNTIDESVNLSGNVLLWHRFGVTEKIYYPTVKKNPLAIIPFAGGISAPETRIAESFQTGIREKLTDSKNYNFNIYHSYFNVLETGLTNIVIIDERVFDDAPKEKNICGININFVLNWYLQNVVIFNLDKKKNNEKDEFILKGYKVDPQCNIKQPQIKPGKPDEINLIKSNSDNHISKYLPEHFKNKVHFLIIHQNIISPKIGGKDEFEKFIKLLPDEYKPCYVVITSGRGHPPTDDMPPKTKFFDFSNLRTFIIDHPNKFLLTKVLTSLKEEKKEEKK